MIEIQPVEKVSGTVTVPGSKSYTNRALLVAALAEGVSRLEKPLVSDDTKYMIRALKGFGIKVEEEPNAFIVSGKAGKLIAQRKIFLLAMPEQLCDSSPLFQL